MKQEKPKRPPGRPAVAPDEKLVIHALRLSRAQIAKLETLGGAAWVRERIDRAKTPQEGQS